jgi:hypothetical protein
MADLLVLTILDQLLFVLKISSTCFYKTIYFNEEVNCTEPSPSVSIPCSSLFCLIVSNEEKRFVTLATGANVIKPFLQHY